MRSPDGQVYEVDEGQVATLQRDQGWTLGDAAPAQPVGEKSVLRGPEGRLYEASSPEEAAQLQRDQDMVPASPEEIAERQEKRDLYSAHGSTGQQALGLAEAFYRNASLGVIQGLIGTEDEQRGRAQVTSEQSPVLYGAASLAPALAAGVATGGAGLGAAGTIAAEGALGGLANLSAEQDAAFLRNQELSAEAAFGAFGKGAILGAGAAGAIVAAPRIISAATGSAAVRNRFAEAAGKAERRAEKAAFKGVGIDKPVDGLADAVIDPAKGAKMRHRGRGAALDARAEFGETLEQLDAAEQAARRWAPESAAAEGDAAAQRAALRSNLDSLRKELEPIASPAEKGVVARAFDMIDRADSPDQLYQAVITSRRVFQDTLGGTADAATAQALKRGVERLEKLEANDALFGAPAAENAARSQQLSDLAQARQALEERLGAANYLEQVGMRAGQPAEEALDAYMDRLGTIVRESKGMPEAKEAMAAIARMQKLRSGSLREVAGLNQIDALSATDPGDLRPQAPSGMQAMVDIAEQAAKYGAAPYYQPYKLAKMAWKSRRLMSGDPAKRAAAAKDMALEVAGFADPIVGPARLAYKYRHHIMVLAETAKDEAVSAARKLAGAAEKEGGAIPLGVRYAKETLGEEQYTQIRKAVQAIQKEPDRLAEHLAGELGNLSAEAPELVMAINARAMAAVQFLASKVPASYGFHMMYPDGPPPSKMDAVEMALYMRGVTDPSDVVRAIGDGSAMPEEIEAFRTVHPTWFSELQEATRDEVAMANEDGRVISAQRIAQLETVLDMPGQLDPTFSDEIANAAQAQLAGNAEEQRSPSYVPQPKAGQRIAPTGATT